MEPTSLDNANKKHAALVATRPTNERAGMGENAGEHRQEAITHSC